MAKTEQEKFWDSSFGKKYTDRNIYSPSTLDKFYKKTLGVTRSKINADFLANHKINNTLEVGCNVGNQLRLLQINKFKNLYGIEIQKDAVERAKKITKGINIIQGSAFELPFKDNYFDLVFTSGVLIHIHPHDLKAVMKEIYRVSKKYIFGLEYYNNHYQEIIYRGHKDRLWKTDFAKAYQSCFPDLKLLKVKCYPYLKNEKNIDSAFLLRK
jgi:pseudaminic acid biosynthesis-associated methylase